MAEIKIEKKKPVWPWVLLVLILLVAIAYFVYANSEDDDYPDDTETEEIDDFNDGTLNDSSTYEDTISYSDSTNAVTQYSESIKDSTRIGTDSTYTKSALYHLAKAVTEKAKAYNLESSKALEDLKAYSSQMDGMGNVSMTNNSGVNKNIKSVSANIVNVMETLQAKQFPNLQEEVNDLKQTSDKISATPLEKQTTTLQAFFRKAHEVLRNLNS